MIFTVNNRDNNLDISDTDTADQTKEVTFDHLYIHNNQTFGKYNERLYAGPKV